MIWDKIFLIFRGVNATPREANEAEREAAAQRVARWSEAVERNPKIAGDLLIMGGILAQTIETYVDKRLQPDDPTRLAREAGRRDLALELLALTNLNHEEYLNMMRS